MFCPCAENEALFASINVNVMPSPPDSSRDSKASRVRVWQAADRILRSGRRPTVEGVRELLGGGSPNSVTAHMNEWYRELGGRLDGVDSPATGFPPAAVALMTELWRLAKADPSITKSANPDASTAKAFEVERDTARADAKALAVLNQELSRHRASAERALAEARAQLTRNEAALEFERSRTVELSRELAATLLESEPRRERAKRPKRNPRRRRPAPPRSAAPLARKSATNRPPKYRSGKRRKGKESPSGNSRRRPGSRRPTPSRRK